jgi:hypothetical protein
LAQQLQDNSMIATVTTVLEPSLRKMLENTPAGNADTICNYTLAEIMECSIRATEIKVLVYLSRFLHHKPFKEMVKMSLPI